MAGLAHTVEHRDGAPPLSDQALTRLASPEVGHVIAEDDGTLVGYAHLDGEVLEIVGENDAVLTALLDAAEATRPGADLLCWSHGQHSPLARLLDERGYRRQRVLHQFRRPLREIPEPPPLADGIRVRAFAVGSDENEWLRVNAAAFADHAEQGTWSMADLRARESEPWFDPAGFLVAERDGRMVGYHWTKVHEDGLGEVYVLGIDPSAQGLGLGAGLLLRGLAHLAARGCPEVLLYVDDDNTGAMRLYERFGFTEFDRDVQWRRLRPSTG